MAISARYHNIPRWETCVINGVAESVGDIYFSPNDDLLIVHSCDSFLRVYRLPSLVSVALPSEFVRRACWSNALNGLLVCRNDSVVLYTFSETSCNCRVLIENLSPLDCEEWVDMASDGIVLIVVSKTWVKVVELVSGQQLVDYAMAPHPDYSIRWVSAGFCSGAPVANTCEYAFDHIRLRSLQFSSSGLVQFEQHEFFRIPDLHRVQSRMIPEGGIHLLGPVSHGEKLSIILKSSGLIFSHLVSGYHKEFLSSISSDAEFLLIYSCTRLSLYRNGLLLLDHKWNRDWYNAWPSPNSDYVVMSFVDGQNPEEYSELVEIFGVGQQKPIGIAQYHACGAPLAISHSGRYIASIITDSVAVSHPNKLPSGSLIISIMPNFVGEN